MKKSHNILLHAWYGNSLWVYCLLPVSWLFRCISFLRKFYLLSFAQKKISVPVIVVGNISVGGTGKTPLIIALVKYLQMQGHMPGVISRGYGGEAPHYPYLLNDSSSAHVSGDEPLLIFNATNCKVCVSPDRVAAAEYLVQQGCSIILGDDGLQHYKLARDMEIAVVDGLRLFGNKQCLPVGPLREPVSRLESVDFVVVNNPQKTQPIHHSSFTMQLSPTEWRQLTTQALISLKQLPADSIFHAIAGIGNPQRFFNTLSSIPIKFEPHPFSDHHKFTSTDFNFVGNSPAVMTEKDAVKCQKFAKDNWYSLVVSARLEPDFWNAFQKKLDGLKK